MKALKGKLLYAAALVLGIFYCIEVFTNGKLSTLNWIGVLIAAAVLVVWLINLGMYISSRKHRIDEKKELKAQQSAEKEAQQLSEQQASDEKRSSAD